MHIPTSIATGLLPSSWLSRGITQNPEFSSSGRTGTTRAATGAGRSPQPLTPSHTVERGLLFWAVFYIAAVRISRDHFLPPDPQAFLAAEPSTGRVVVIAPTRAACE